MRGGELDAVDLQDGRLGVGQVDDLARTLSAQHALTRLDIESNPQLGDAGVAALARALPAHAGLRTLQLGETGLGDEGARAVARALAKLSRLEEIHLSENAIGDSGMAAVSGVLARQARLRVLALHANHKLGDAGVKALASALGRLANLEKLTLSDNKVGDGGAAAVAKALSRGHAHLNELTLGEGVGDAGAEALGPALGACPALEWLSLGTRLTAGGASALARGLRGHLRLRVLMLNLNTHMGDEGAEALSALLPTLPAFEGLHLFGAGLSDRGAVALCTALRTAQPSPPLRTLDLRGNPAIGAPTAKAAAQLREAMAARGGGAPTVRLDAAPGAAKGDAASGGACCTVQ